MLSINIVVEGDSDLPVIKKIVKYVGFNHNYIYGGNGKGYILKKLDAFNKAARNQPWLVVVDLDQDLTCAPQLIQKSAINPSAGMCFRIAVREMEAWLMADSERLAKFLGISPSEIPENPDAILYPKEFLIDLARKSPFRSIRNDLVPKSTSKRVVGPRYINCINEFVNYSKAPWRPEIAEEHSDSLRRCIDALVKLMNYKP